MTTTNPSTEKGIKSAPISTSKATAFPELNKFVKTKFVDKKGKKYQVKNKEDRKQSKQVSSLESLQNLMLEAKKSLQRLARLSKYHAPEFGPELNTLLESVLDYALNHSDDFETISEALLQFLDRNHRELRDKRLLRVVHTWMICIDPNVPKGIVGFDRRVAKFQNDLQSLKKQEIKVNVKRDEVTKDVPEIKKNADQKEESKTNPIKLVQKPELILPDVVETKSTANEKTSATDIKSPPLASNATPNITIGEIEEKKGEQENKDNQQMILPPSAPAEPAPRDEEKGPQKSAPLVELPDINKDPGEQKAQVNQEEPLEEKEPNHHEESSDEEDEKDVQIEHVAVDQTKHENNLDPWTCWDKAGGVYLNRAALDLIVSNSTANYEKLLAGPAEMTQLNFDIMLLATTSWIFRHAENRKPAVQLMHSPNAVADYAAAACAMIPQRVQMMKLMAKNTLADSAMKCFPNQHGIGLHDSEAEKKHFKITYCDRLPFLNFKFQDCNLTLDACRFKVHCHNFAMRMAHPFSYTARLQSTYVPRRYVSIGFEKEMHELAQKGPVQSEELATLSTGISMKNQIAGALTAHRYLIPSSADFRARGFNLTSRLSLLQGNCSTYGPTKFSAPVASKL